MRKEICPPNDVQLFEFYLKNAAKDKKVIWSPRKEIVRNKRKGVDNYHKRTFICGVIPQKYVNYYLSRKIEGPLLAG